MNQQTLPANNTSQQEVSSPKNTTEFFSKTSRSFFENIGRFWKNIGRFWKFLVMFFLLVSWGRFWSAGERWIVGVNLLIYNILYKIISHPELTFRFAFDWLIMVEGERWWNRFQFYVGMGIVCFDRWFATGYCLRSCFIRLYCSIRRLRQLMIWYL